MDGYRAFLRGGHHLGLLLQSADDAVYGVEEVLLLHALLAVARCYESRLVADIGNVGTRESRSLACQHLHIHTGIPLDRTEMHLEYRLALVEVRQVNADLPVETTGSEQCLVEHVGTVCGSQHYDSAVGAETVHLGEQCVEGALPLVVAAHRRVLAARTSHGIDFVDEYDAGSLLLGLAEEVADAACAHTYEHLHEVGTAHGEERYAGLAGHCLGKQRLTGSRRTDEEGACGYLAAQLGVFLRILQEVYDFLHLLLGAFLSGYVLEGYRVLVFLLVVNFRLALAYAEDAGASAATHPAHQEYPDGKEEDDRSYGLQDIHQYAALVALIAQSALEYALRTGCVDKALQFVHTAILYLHERVGAHLFGAGIEHRADVVRLYEHLELAVVFVHDDALGIALSHISLEVGVGQLFAGAATGGVASHDEGNYQSDDAETVNPTHVELGHLVVVFIVVAEIIVRIHVSSIEFPPYIIYRAARHFLMRTPVVTLQSCLLSVCVDVGNYRYLGILPEVFQIVVFAHFRQEDMHHHVGIVHCHPLRVCQSGNLYRLLSSLYACRLLH